MGQSDPLSWDREVVSHGSHTPITQVRLLLPRLACVPVRVRNRKGWVRLPFTHIHYMFSASGSRTSKGLITELAWRISGILYHMEFWRPK